MHWLYTQEKSTTGHFMKIHRSVWTCIAVFLFSAQSSAHEFWIEPSLHHADTPNSVDILLKVGQNFRGNAQPYLPTDIARFELITERKTIAIKGLMGDSRPAAKITPEAGLNRVIHHTTPYSIAFDTGDQRWADYVALDGLANQLNKFPDLPKETPVSERYVRSVKTLITVGAGPFQDKLTGRIPFEFVRAGPFTRLLPGSHTFTLYDKDRPMPGILVKAFRQEDRMVVDENVTNAAGQINLTLPSSDRYMISGVVIRPDYESDNNWISHWPSLTLEVAD
jgi:cobalt/nickel transport protein|tara:strand:- start:27007 stop:27846 length:840 start_codon:yes stop_codon:yes gene_type:complete